ncbi:MAG: hypothetical protein M3Y86_01200 [Verrucomicrobiota bacterium]|nr:hypothetical protein [Verrucomicrobiota bacterium]
MKCRLLLLLLLAPFCAFAQAPPTLDETARFLAGMSVQGPLAPLTQMPAWQEHARAMDEAWGKKERQQILPIRDWMLTNAPEFFGSNGTMFYMFGGPDFLYANTFFPNADTYILAGLEPIGDVSDLTQFPPDAVVGGLPVLRASLSNILRFQYFITKDMRAELGKNGVSGVLPLFYVFLARTGHAVLSVERLTSPAEGVKIIFRDPERAQAQTLFYFKTDLSDGHSAFLKWCATQGPGLSLIKAASYLMHGEGFDGVKNFLLQNSRVLIQDDSGIPLRDFPRGWSVHIYGHYVPHRTDFAKYWQPDLAAFIAQNPAGPLGFAFGYHWEKDEGFLMLATPTGGEKQRRELEVRRALPAD